MCYICFNSYIVVDGINVIICIILIQVFVTSGECVLWKNLNFFVLWCFTNHLLMQLLGWSVDSRNSPSWWSL